MRVKRQLATFNLEFGSTVLCHSVPSFANKWKRLPISLGTFWARLGGGAAVVVVTAGVRCAGHSEVADV